jgi:hypothetical protein
MDAGTDFGVLLQLGPMCRNLPGREEGWMSKNLSVAQILADLEAQIAHLEAQAPFHARQEAFHRAEKQRCETEIEQLRERYEAFKSASAAAGEVVLRSKGPGHPAREVEKDDGRPTSTKNLIAWVISAKADGDSFGATAVTQEVNARFAKRLRQPVNVRSVSVALSRMASAGALKIVREGKAHHEALYAKSTRAKRS